MSTKQRCGLALAFGLMLAFLQLLLVAADDQVVCTTQSPILPRNDLYNQYCPNEMGDKGYRACFTHRSGSLYGADISPLLNRLEVDSENIIVAKDSDLSGRLFTLGAFFIGHC
ncbi:hypothetical protein [Sporisorium scitamineum]|uniref:Mig1 protein n=1 Tax=Sporisorium scitamineum TaxID=49012 RepID=A0A0F7S5U9_9BASI|nr:hypothetical protein [Sporisorium scitamineum]